MASSWIKVFCIQGLILAAIAGVACGASARSNSKVTISSPTPSTTVASPVHCVAYASSKFPIIQMTVSVDGGPVYTVQAGQVDTYLTVASGSHTLTVSALDSKGRTSLQSETFTVSTSSNPSPGPVTVGISPTSASVLLGQSQQFTASVSGTTNTSVSWAVNGIAGGNNVVGTISSAGKYTAPSTLPSPASATVSATSVADASAVGSASINLTAPSPVTVGVSPTSASVQLGQAQQFTASVSGTANTSVTWAVNGISGGNSVVGTVSSAGKYTAPSTLPSPASATVSATSVADTNAVGSAAVALTAPPPNPSAAGYYGSGINADELANLRVGVDGPKVSLRFRAATSSDLSAIRVYVKTGSGYSGGTGGSWKIDLETDDNTANHFPSGYSLATTSTSSLSGGFPAISFPSPAQLNEGQIYHIVISNSDPNPTVNFVSVNNLVTFSMPSPMQPTVPDSSWMTLLYTSSWTNNKKTPVLELDYSNGASQGVGYVDAWASSLANISGNSIARETFTVSGSDRAAVSVSVRVARSSGSSALNVRLEQSNGSLIEEGSVPASAATSTEGWVTYTFSSVRTLAAGQSYNIVLSTASDTTYTTEAIQKGQNYGFSSTTFFKDGHAEVNSGSGWSGVRSRTDSDFEFYFTTQ